MKWEVTYSWLTFMIFSFKWEHIWIKGFRYKLTEIINSLNALSVENKVYSNYCWVLREKFELKGSIVSSKNLFGQYLTRELIFDISLSPIRPSQMVLLLLATCFFYLERASDSLLMLSAEQGNHWYHFF